MSNSQPVFPTTTTIGGQAQVIGVVVGSLDAQGNFQAANATTGLPVSGASGGSAGSAIAEELVQDSSGTPVQYVRRTTIGPTGTTTVAYFNYDGSAGSPTLPVKAITASGGGAITVADGADVTQGAIADAVITAGASGSVSAKLRAISRDVGTSAAASATQATAANQTTGNTSLATIAAAPIVATAVVKAASTAAAATDPSLVVSISPNNAVGILDAAGTNKATVRAANSSANATTDTALVTSVIWNGANPATAAFGAGSAQGLGTYAGNIATSSEITAGTWTATSGVSATIQAVSGISTAFSIGVVFAAGSSTGLDIVLRESVDGGTSFFDVWHCERITTTGSYKFQTPPLPTSQAAFRQWGYSNAGGAATTATTNVIANRLSTVVAPTYQFFDRTAGLLAGTAAATSAAFNVSGCKVITASITIATKAGTTDASYQIQTSADGTNWANVGTATSTLVVGTNDITILNNSKRFARLAVITAAVGTAQVGSVVAITAVN